MLELFSSNLKGNLAYIKSNFGGISTTTSCLEAGGAEMNDALVLVKSTESEVRHAQGKVADSMNTLRRLNETLKEASPAVRPH